MARVTTRDVTVDGVRSLVRIAGAQDKSEAVVFMHGNPGSSEDWTELLGRTGDFARAIAPDMPGFGKADRPRDFEYTVPGYARHLGGVLKQLGVSRAHLVVHDFGGPWGLAWAAQHPDEAASVTLINIGVLKGYRWHKFARIWQTPIVGEIFQLISTRVAFRAALNADNPKPFPREFVDRMYDDADWGNKRAVLKLYRASRDVEPMNRQLAEALAPRKLPAIVVWGKGDKFLPYSYAEKQKEVFAVEAVHLLDGCGHWPFVDEPEKVANIVLPFLRKQVGVKATNDVHSVV
jgi:pimeloyl-ACP methyl ester carboxylesterase